MIIAFLLMLLARIVSGYSRDVDHFRRSFDIHLHQIDQIGAAGDEFRVWIASDLPHRVHNIVGARIVKVDHDRLISAHGILPWARTPIAHTVSKT
jgi:hypothetical protein